MGIWTVGYGHAHVAPDTVWTQEEAQTQLEADVAETEAALHAQLPWWTNLDDIRQDVVCEMGFNMGVSKLCDFHLALTAMQAGDWSTASAEMLDSAWAVQVGARAQRLARQMLTGVHQA